MRVLPNAPRKHLLVRSQSTYLASCTVHDHTYRTCCAVVWGRVSERDLSHLISSHLSRCNRILVASGDRPFDAF